MRALVRWSVRNTPAMNTLLAGLLLVGALSLSSLRREVFPEFELEIVLVSVPYPGATPAEVEEGICQKVEEAVRSISGIKRQLSVAQEGAGYVVLELEASVRDVPKLLADVRAEVDRIPSFPELAEDPQVQQITLRQPAIRLGVLGPDDRSPEGEWQLRQLAERVRDELLLLPNVSQANLVGARDYQIDIEISEDTLRKYGLTLKQVAAMVRRENLELPGGSIKSDSQEVLLRGKNKGLTGKQIARVPLVVQPDGVVLTVGDLATVRDEFDDKTALNEINGRPGMVISVDRTSSEDLLAIVADVKRYAATAALPPGYELRCWADRSVDVRDRMELLARNGLQGLALVFLVLAVFLELRLAFWVALGIPISILGSCAYLLYAGETLNMLSMFAFLMALGIVVDDAIVIGENVYSHRQRGKGPLQAAIDGTVEVFPSVAASVSTTVIAFLPLAFVSGVMGKFIAVLPVTIIAVLLISLFEAVFILPCHLAHERNLLLVALAHLLYPLRFLAALSRWLNERSSRLLAAFIARVYEPLLGWVLQHPATSVSAALAVMICSFGLVVSIEQTPSGKRVRLGGITPFVVFPKLDSNSIFARVVYPDGTPPAVADAATQRLEAAIRQIDRQYVAAGASPLVELTHRAVGEVTSPGALGPDTRVRGSHVGNVDVELVDTSRRAIDSQQIIARWRAAAGEFPGAESLVFGTPSFGPAGTPIEFKLLAPAEQMAGLEAAVAQSKARLLQYPGVFDVADDARPGKWEFQLRIRDEALAMGIPLAELAETVRSAYYGEEVMRLQRGRHEVKLMVRYPREDRRSLADFENIRVRAADGAERPLTELAEVGVQRDLAEINRIEQMRSITVSADVDEAVGNARQITSDLQARLVPALLAQFPYLRVRWEGQQEQTNESVRSLILGLLVALVAMFVLLTLEFRSYAQPLIIMAIIPFGIVGAIWGHAAMGLPLTMFSLFGIVALTGVVVNDSIVLIDFINHRLAEGLPLRQAITAAGSARFRAVLLTSVTTVAGVSPLVAEQSFQAQILVPMAVSLCAGLMLATVLVLLLVPAFYLLYASFVERVFRPVAEVAEAAARIGPVFDSPAASANAPPASQALHEPPPLSALLREGDSRPQAASAARPLQRRASDSPAH